MSRRSKGCPPESPGRVATLIPEEGAVCHGVAYLVTPEEFAHSLRLLAEGQVDAPSLITAKVGLDGVKSAFAELGNPEKHTKILVEPWR